MPVLPVVHWSSSYRCLPPLRPVMAPETGPPYPLSPSPKRNENLHSPIRSVPKYLTSIKQNGKSSTLSAKYTPRALHPYSLLNFFNLALSDVGSASAAAPGELIFGVGFGEVGLPFRRAREWWKKRREERRRCRRDDGAGRGWEENVKFAVGFEWLLRVVVKVL